MSLRVTPPPILRDLFTPTADEPWSLRMDCNEPGCQVEQTLLVPAVEVARCRLTIGEIAAVQFESCGWQIEPTRCPDHATKV